jgi:hypothetical protein
MKRLHTLIAPTSLVLPAWNPSVIPTSARLGATVTGNS